MNRHWKAEKVLPFVLLLVDWQRCHNPVPFLGGCRINMETKNMSVPHSEIHARMYPEEKALAEDPTSSGRKDKKEPGVAKGMVSESQTFWSFTGLMEGEEANRNAEV